MLFFDIVKCFFLNQTHNKINILTHLQQKTFLKFTAMEFFSCKPCVTYSIHHFIKFLHLRPIRRCHNDNLVEKQSGSCFPLDIQSHRPSGADITASYFGNPSQITMLSYIHKCHWRFHCDFFKSVLHQYWWVLCASGQREKKLFKGA